MQLSGRQIKEILEHSVSGAHGILQVSGLKFVYDLEKPKGERVIEIKVDDKPLLSEKFYSVVTNNFVAAGGDGYLTFLEGKNIVDTKKKLRDLEIEYIKKHSPISATVEGRIVKYTTPETFE